jgi:signal transduction histidine kinase
MLKVNKLLSGFILLLVFYGFTDSRAQEDIAKVRELLTSSNDKSKPYTEIINISDSAILICEKINYLQGKADALNIKGRAYMKLGEYSNAMDAFFEELGLREKNTGWENSSIGYLYAQIGEAYRAISNFDLAIEFLNKGKIIVEEKKDNKSLAYIYNRFAAVYHELSFRRTDTSYSFKAVEMANRSLEINNEFNDVELLLSNYNIIGSAYAFRGEYDEALEYLLNGLSIADKDTNYSDKPNIMNNISSVYSSKGDYDKAIEYAYRSHEISEKSGIKIYVLVSARALSDAYSKKKDYKNAFLYLLEAHDLYLTLFDERKTAEIYGLQKKHENELIIQEENAKAIRRITFGISFIIIVIVVSIVIYLKHKQQILLNKELEKKNSLISSQKEEMFQVNAAKDKFFSILSHDIRNPLNGILGFSNILESEFEEINDEEKKEYIGYIKTSSESLFRLIDKVLIWSRLETGRFELEKSEINLSEIVSHAVSLQKPNSIRKGIMLESKVSDSINVYADKNFLDTVIRNLIDNAVKFTEAGGNVSVEAQVTGNTVTIGVADTGVGIDKAALDKIFHIDQKITSKGTDLEEGSGLGLILCKEMLEVMGSTLKVDSEKGKGSKFYFDLPVY